MITADDLARYGNTLGQLRHLTATATTTPSIILDAEPDRLRHKLTITNAGDENVFLALGELAITNAGICLTPGATFSLDRGEFFNGKVSAVTAANTSTLCIFTATKGALP